jgi:hypothetical protein
MLPKEYSTSTDLIVPSGLEYAEDIVPCSCRKIKGVGF